MSRGFHTERVAVLDAANGRNAMTGVGEARGKQAERLGYLGLGIMGFPMRRRLIPVLMPLGRNEQSQQVRGLDHAEQ